jgi:hypothetical protein
MSGWTHQIRNMGRSARKRLLPFLIASLRVELASAPLALVPNWRAAATWLRPSDAHQRELGAAGKAFAGTARGSSTDYPEPLYR